MAYREGGMAALRPRNRNASQTNKPTPRRSRNAGDGNDDAEALRRRIEELEPRNALMREVVEARRKDPGANPRRLSNREKTLPADRLRPTYSLNSMRIGILRKTTRASIPATQTSFRVFDKTPALASARWNHKRVNINGCSTVVRIHQEYF